MPNKNTIRVSEFEKLYYDDSKPFKQKHWDALCRYQENINKSDSGNVEYYKILNKGIQFTNYVGVIQAGSLTIEILPKIDREKTYAINQNFKNLTKEEAEEKQVWHKVLLQMLKECSFLKVNHVDYASLKLKSNSILDIYLELFLSEVEKILHEGLLKKYRKVEGNKLSMKGQLVFPKNIQQNLVHKERFYVRYTEYNQLNIFNQLLYKTICLIPSINNNTLITDKVNRLLLDFPEMPDCIATLDTFNKLAYDRKTERYKEALLISKMLLLNYRPDITGGVENVIAILFDMNKLWEEFVYRRIKKEESIIGVNVKRQGSEDFWKPEKADRSKAVRPDIIIKEGNRTIIVDTKWKVIRHPIPEDDDLKQMFVYNLFWNCEKSILLYPAVKEFSGSGDYHDFRKQESFFTACSIATINVLDINNNLDKDFGIRVLKNIMA